MRFASLISYTRLWKTAAAVALLPAWMEQASGQQERRPFASHTERTAPQSAAAEAGRSALAPVRSAQPAQPARQGSPTTPDTRTLDENRPALNEVFRILTSRQRGLNLNIWFPNVAALGNAEIAQGAAVAEGVALRTGYVPVSVSCIPGIAPGKFNVAIGTLDQLRGMLTAEDTRTFSNGYLVLRKIPNRPDTHLLLITGRTPEGVDSAILSLGIAREKLPGVPTAAIQDVVLPKAPPFLRREPLRPDTVYTFQELQNAGTSLVPLANRRLRIELMLPGDFSPEYQGDFVFDLHFSQPQRSFRGVERVSIRVNDLAADIATGEATTIIVGGARAAVGVPARLFRQGNNVVDIDFPGVSSDGFTLYPDSTLALPPCSVAPPLPNLRITTRTAYPFVGQPDGSEMSVYLAGSDIETVESAWTFLAKLAQVSNTLFHAAEFHSSGDGPPRPTNRHVLAIGNVDSVPEEYRRLMPPDIFREVLQEPPEKQLAAHGLNLKQAIIHSRQSASDALFATGDPSRTDFTDGLETGTPPASEWNRQERGYLGSFPPEENSHGWVLLLTAESPSLLRQRTEELILPAFWERISGGSVYWNHRPESLEVYSEAPRPLPEPQLRKTREQDVEMPLGETYSTRNWAIATAITLLVFVVSLTKSLQKISSLRDYL